MDLDMRFSPAVDPATGLEPVGTVESVEATALLEETAPGVWSHQGDTEIAWDTQHTRRDDRGRVLLIDTSGSTWWAEVEERP